MTEIKRGKSTTTMTPSSIPWASRRVRGKRIEGLRSREKKTDRCGLKLESRKEKGAVGEEALPYLEFSLSIGGSS